MKKPEHLPEFDWAYNPENWEYTWHVDDFGEMMDNEIDGADTGTVVAMNTLIEGPTIYGAKVPISFDAHGDWDETEIQWFNTEEDATAAVNITNGDQIL